MKPLLTLIVATLITIGCSWNTYRYLAVGVDERCFDLSRHDRDSFGKMFPIPQFWAGSKIDKYPDDKGGTEGMRTCTTTEECVTGEDTKEECTVETKCTTEYYPMPTEEECLAQMASMRSDAWHGYVAASLAIITGIFTLGKKGLRGFLEEEAV